jgi:hypothetical protein
MQKLEEALRYLKVLDDFLAGASVSAKGVEERCGLPAMLLSDRIASVRAAADALRVDLQARIGTQAGGPSA